jgi:hypothetical protein
VELVGRLIDLVTAIVLLGVGYLHWRSHVIHREDSRLYDDLAKDRRDGYPGV